jgi:uncharacterized protein YdeI (BOF family)
MKVTLAMAAVFFASTSGLVGIVVAPQAKGQDPHSPQTQQAPKDSPTDTQIFGGRITKSNGSYMLRDSSGKISYMLDDQKTAKHYEGKIVVVTGTMDHTTNIIHVQKIEAAA